MQAPAIFLIAAILLFASMWSSDAAYVDHDVEELAIKAGMEEAEVAYRNSVSVQKEMIVRSKADERTPLVEMNDELAVDSQMMSNEISIPVLIDDALMFDGSIQMWEDCRWMTRISEADVVTQENNNQQWQEVVAEKVTTVSKSILHLSNSMLITIIEMHKHQQETQLSASSKKSVKQ